MNNPLVSVIIPCYNAEKYVEEAVRSIMTQTYENLEILVTDDCSMDNTLKILKNLEKEDSRIKVIENKENLKIVKSLNNMIDIAQGKYIARMDADDISLPERIEKQVQFMEENPEYGLCGTNAWIIDENGNIKSKTNLPITNEEILFYTKYLCPFYHPTIMVQSNIIKVNKYLDKIKYAEDYELWCRLVYQRKIKTKNLCTRLLRYRKTKGQITNKFRDTQLNTVISFFEENGMYSTEKMDSFKKVICMQGDGLTKFDKEFIKEILNKRVKYSCKKNIYKRVIAYLFKVKSLYLLILLIRPDFFICFAEIILSRLKK